MRAARAALLASLLGLCTALAPSSSSAAPTAPTAPPAPPAVPSARFADLDPDNDSLVGAPDEVADCAGRLRAAGVDFRVSEVPLSQKRGETYTCGAPQGVVYKRGPERIRYSSAPLVTCNLALALAEFERVLQEEALRSFGKRVRRIEQAGTYSCRRMSRFQHMVSEHSWANAIDLRAFVLEDGQRISVLQHFGRIDQEPKTAKSRFLRTLARRLYNDEVFSVVLTPYWDALHRDHFHLDLARYRVDGTR